MAHRFAQHSQAEGIAGFLRALMVAVVSLLATYYGVCTLLLIAYTVVLPPTTGVQMQRRMEALFDEEPYETQYEPVAPSEIDASLEHAVIAAEDTRFYQHSGVDWKAVRKAVEDNLESGTVERGGSTITQQLVKNLFMTTHSSYLRKALELPLTLLAEGILSKDRMLALYLNVIEWDRGVFGAEAAAQHYYGVPANGLSRYQAAALAAVIPDPLGRSPQSMGWYTQIILARMSNLYPTAGASSPQPTPEPEAEAPSEPAETEATSEPAKPDSVATPPVVPLDPLETAPPTTESPESDSTAS